MCRQTDDDIDYNDHLFRFLRLCEGFAVLMDDVDHYCQANSFSFDMKRFVNKQRHSKTMDVVCCSRRAAAVHRDLSALATDLWVFHTHEPRDLEYIRSIASQEIADQCRNLKKWEHLHKNFYDFDISA